MNILLSRATVLGVGIVLTPIVLGAVLLIFLLIAMIGAANDVLRALKTKLGWKDARARIGVRVKSKNSPAKIAARKT